MMVLLTTSPVEIEHPCPLGQGVVDNENGNSLEQRLQNLNIGIHYFLKRSNNSNDHNIVLTQKDL